MSEPTVFIVDDDPSALRGLSLLVRAAGMNAQAYASAADFLASDRTGEPGCLVLDVRMPQMTGPELQEKLSKADYSMPIIFLSAHADVPISVQAMKLGAIDFLEKPVDQEDLLAAIRLSLARDAEARAQHAEVATLRERLGTLTPREHQVMTYVITGLLNKQIAAELHIAEKTVKVHRARVMEKLEIVSVAELVRICETVGIPPAETRIR